MAYIQSAGRGPTQKTGAGIPSDLLQPDPVEKKKDEKSGKNPAPALGAYNSSMSAPVPTKSEDAVKDSIVSSMHAADVEDDKRLNTKKEKAYEKVLPVRNQTYNIGGRGKKINVEVSSIDEKTGDVSYQNAKTGKRSTASRSSWRDMSISGRSLKRFVGRENTITASKK